MQELFVWLCPSSVVLSKEQCPATAKPYAGPGSPEAVTDVFLRLFILNCFTCSVILETFGHIYTDLAIFKKLFVLSKTTQVQAWLWSGVPMMCDVCVPFLSWQNETIIPLCLCVWVSVWVWVCEWVLVSMHTRKTNRDQFLFRHQCRKDISATRLSCIDSQVLQPDCMR